MSSTVSYFVKEYFTTPLLALESQSDAALPETRVRMSRQPKGSASYKPIAPQGEPPGGE